MLNLDLTNSEESSMLIKNLTLWEVFYLTSWMTYSFISLFILYKNRKDEVLLSKKYFLFLTKPWKLTTFLISGTFITAIGPYTNDPTWDPWNGAIMSILTFCTAPWAVASIYKIFRRELSPVSLIPVSGLWLLSASWSYDLYLVLRDGFYPETWVSNMIVSSVIYASAGLLWNLDYNVSMGTHFSFSKLKWPEASEGAVFAKLLWIAIPFMLLAFYLTATLIDFN